MQINYQASTDKKTIVNLTNHTYFNLAGVDKGSILNHEVMINADRFVPIDSSLIPTGNLEDVAETPFDFRKPRKPGDSIDEADDQLFFAKGYDHCWALNGELNKKKLAATVYEPNSGRYLEVFTTEPGVQFYTGNFLTGNLQGRNGHRISKRSGLCLETEHFSR